MYGGLLMTIPESILDIIKSEYASGKTQDEIAKMLNLTQTDVQKFLCGKRSVDSISIKTLCRMFPNACLCIKPVENETGVNINVVLNFSKAINYILNTLNMDDIPAETKIDIISSYLKGIKNRGDFLNETLRKL